MILSCEQSQDKAIARVKGLSPRVLADRIEHGENVPNVSNCGNSMKRDMDLVRELIFAIENSDHGFAPHVAVEGFSDEQIRYHYYIMIQAGLITGTDLTHSGSSSPQALPSLLTWAGHEFADAARSDTIWEKAKKTIKEKVGSASFELFTRYLAKLGKEALGM